MRFLGWNVSSISFFYLGLMLSSPLGETSKNNFLKSSSWVSVSNVMSIFFLERFTMETTRDDSSPTFVIPKSMFWFYVFSTSSLNETPSPLISTSILLRPLMSKLTTSLYLMQSRGVNTIGTLRTFDSKGCVDFLSLICSLRNGRTTCPDAILTSRNALFS